MPPGVKDDTLVCVLWTALPDDWKEGDTPIGDHLRAEGAAALCCVADFSDDNLSRSEVGLKVHEFKFPLRTFTWNSISMRVIGCEAVEPGTEVLAPCLVNGSYTVALYKGTVLRVRPGSARSASARVYFDDSQQCDVSLSKIAINDANDLARRLASLPPGVLDAGELADTDSEYVA